MVAIGQKVLFDPFHAVTGFAIKIHEREATTGNVVYINRQNEWFSVEYVCGGVKQRTSFNFSQIGKDVMICGK